jgi:hypothetical protein
MAYLQQIIASARPAPPPDVLASFLMTILAQELREAGLPVPAEDQDWVRARGFQFVIRHHDKAITLLMDVTRSEAERMTGWWTFFTRAMPPRSIREALARMTQVTAPAAPEE